MPSNYSPVDDPEPVSIDRDRMLTELARCGIHPDSPAGRGVLLLGDELDDGAGGSFVTPSSLRPVAPAGTRSAAPFTGHLDNGDKVAAAMGLPGVPQPPAQPARAPSNKSAQELVCEAMGLTSPSQNQE